MSSVGTILLGVLDINDGDLFRVITNPAQWRQSGGVLQMELIIHGASQAQIETRRRAILNELHRAEVAWARGRESERVMLQLEWGNSGPIAFAVRGGEITPLRLYPHTSHARATLRVQVEHEHGVPLAQLEPDVRQATAALANGSATVLLDGVGGDRPARVKLRISDESDLGVINRIRLSAISGESLQVTDWSPWVDAVNAGSADQSDQSAFGGSYERVALPSSTTWTYLARATMPAGALQRGRRHLYLRVRDNATAVAAPGNLGSTIDAPAVPGSITSRQARALNNGSGGTTLSVGPQSQTLAGSTLVIAVKAQHPPVPLPTRRQGGTTSGATSSSPSRNWAQSTLQGSLLRMVLKFTGDYDNWTPPSNWAIANVQINDQGDTQVNIVELYREGAASTSGAQSGGSFANSTFWVMATEEWTGIATSGALVAVGKAAPTTGTSATVSLTLRSDVPIAAVLASTALDSTATNVARAWSNGFDEVSDAGGLATAARVVTSSGPVSTDITFFGSSADHATIMTAYRAASFTPEPLAITPPSGYALGGIISNLDDIQRPVTTAMFYRQNAPATSGNLTVTFDKAVVATGTFIELPGVAESGALVANATSTDDRTIASLGPTSIVEHEGAVALAALGAHGTTTSWSGWSGGFSEVSDAAGLGVARLSSAEIQAWAVAALKSTSDSSAHVLLVFRQDVATEEDAPGGLDPGQYGARVRAVTVGGGYGTPSGTHNATVTVAGSAIEYSWSAPSATGISHYELEITYGGETYLVVTESNATSYRLESLAGLARRGFGNTGAAPALVQVQAGTTGMTASSSSSRNENFEVVWTGPTRRDMLGKWHWLPAGAGHFPPQEQMADGSEPDWAIEVFGRSGGGPSADFDIDAMLLLSDESGMTLEYPGYNLGIKRVWVAEVRADGSVVAWLEDGAGNVVGQIRPVGALRISPGDNLLALVAEQAGEVASGSNLKMSLSVTLYPVVEWLV